MKKQEKTMNPFKTETIVYLVLFITSLLLYLINETESLAFIESSGIFVLFFLRMVLERLNL